MLKAVFGGMALLGLVATAFGIYFILFGNAAASWPETQGTVVSTTIQTSTARAATGTGSAAVRRREALRQYYPSITYRWTVDGQTYTGSQYQVGTTAPKFDEPEQAQAEADKHPAGSAIPVFYDPANPSTAVLAREVSSGVYAPLALGFVMLVLGAGGLKFLPQLSAAQRKAA